MATKYALREKTSYLNNWIRKKVIAVAMIKITIIILANLKPVHINVIPADSQYQKDHNVIYPHFMVSWSISYSVLFLLRLHSTTQILTTHAHSHPYKHMYVNPTPTRKRRGIAADGQWMYLWYLMGTKVQIESFYIDFMMISMKRTCFVKSNLKMHLNF